MSRIVLGLMRIESMSVDQVMDLLRFASSKGITKIDLADIYGGTRCESLVGEAFEKDRSLRERFLVQTKVGISLDGVGYDSSKDYLIRHVKDSLSRLRCGHLDSLLIHRPDVFMDAEEVAEAIEELQSEGLVRDFGVSNFNTSEIRYLQKTLRTPIRTNQVQLGLGNTTMIDQIMMTNVPAHRASKEADDLFFFLKGEGITIQCWSPFQVGFFEGSLFDGDRYPEINAALRRMAEKYRTSPCAIATAFLLALTRDIEVVVGSTNPTHIQEAIDGESIRLSKSDWYELYRDSGHFLP